MLCKVNDFFSKKVNCLLKKHLFACNYCLRRYANYHEFIVNFIVNYFMLEDVEPEGRPHRTSES